MYDRFTSVCLKTAKLCIHTYRVPGVPPIFVVSDGVEQLVRVLTLERQEADPTKAVAILGKRPPPAVRCSAHMIVSDTR